MANTLYNTARERFLLADINWDLDDIKVLLVKTSDYTFNAADTNLTNINSAAYNFAAAQTLTTSVTTDGAADANDVTFSAVPSGHQIGAILIYQQLSGGTEADTVLIAWLDTATGLPITSNGGDIIITWDNGVNRIFRL